MDIYAIRRARLKMLVDELAHGNAAQFAATYGYSRSQIYQFLSPKYNNGHSMGERAARELEAKIKGAPGWLDRPMRTLDGLVSESKFTPADFSLAHRIDNRKTVADPPGIPMLGRAHVGKNGEIIDTVRPKNKGDLFLEINFQGRDLFALQIIGILQWPRLKSGDLIVVQNGLMPGPGDDVLLTQASGSSILQLLHSRDDIFVFSLINDLNPTLSLRKDEIVSMNKIIMVVSHLEESCIERLESS